jgi:hypothetical protein
MRAWLCVIDAIDGAHAARRIDGPDFAAGYRDTAPATSALCDVGP